MISKAKSWFFEKIFSLKRYISRLKKESDFPSGPVVKTPRFHFRGHGFNPWSGKFHMLCGVAKKNQTEYRLFKYKQ